MTLNEQALYLGDNGRLTCGALRCAGMTAHFTGRDLSGQRMHKVTPSEAQSMARDLGPDIPVACEGCGKRAPLIHVVA